jgi:hypothetical protein
VIDFRYHLVSIISIFLALAVGIVLGAGPLQATIGDTLGDQVVALRSEKQTLNDKLTASEKLVEASGEYESAVQPRVVEGRLTGHRVVVVVLPSADGTLADDLENVIPQSGATSTGAVTVSPDWFDPTQAGDREQAARQAASALGLRGTASGDSLLDQVLAHLLVSRTDAASSTQRTTALKVLADAGLVDSSVDDLAPADLAIVVSGDFAGTQATVDQRSEGLRAILTGLAQGSNGTVVAGGEPVAAAGQPVSSDAVSAVRSKSETADVVATVDHARAGNGPGIVVLALEGLLDDRVGHYGISTGATATVPRVLP